MLGLNDVVQAIYTVTRVVTVPVNIHAIVYLAGRDWAMFERDGAYVIYKTTDTQGNPVTIRLRVREMGGPTGSHYYEVYGMEMQFKYLGQDFLAIYPVSGGFSKAKVDDKYLLDISTKISGEPCIAALRIGQVPAICKQIGKFYLVIVRA